MARGRFLSRKYEPPPPRPRSPEELRQSRNPLVQLGLAFKRVRKLAPEPLPSSTEVQESVPRRPLVDIDDVRKFLREKLAITKEVSTIPIPHHSWDAPLHSPVAATTSSETTHPSSQHSYSSDASSLPAHDAAPGVATPFDVGTVGHPIVEASEPRRVQSTEPSSSPRLYSLVGEPRVSNVADLGWDMRDVQEFVGGVLEVVRSVQNWGLPETSWQNKMPWHSPPPKILARGLQRPPERFASEEERLAFNRSARKRRKFLTGCPPTWSFMVANVALLAFLVYNPLG